MTPYRILICGDRSWDDGELILHHLGLYKDKHDDMELIVGDCTGADAYAANAAVQLEIPYRVFVADWSSQGPPAGPIRNKKMVDEKPSVVLAFHDNIDYSRGTKDCTRQAQKQGILVKVITHIEENV